MPRLKKKSLEQKAREKKEQRANETEEDASKRRTSDRLHKANVRANETEEEASERRTSDRLHKANVRANETEEEACERRTSDRLHKADARANETEEEARERKKSDRLYKADVKANETKEERNERRKSNRLCQADVREKQKSVIPTIDEATAKFKKEIKQMPVFICTSCHRLLYKKGVQGFKRKNYDNVDKKVVDQVLAERFMKKSIDGKQYICHTCHRTLKKDKVPVQSKGNFMDLDPQPEVLQGLKPCELRLISRRIPFIRLISLPRGKQKGIKGAAVNVPADLGPVSSLLPRLPSEAHIIPLNLKRKLEYKHSYLTDLIQPAKVMEALKYLKKNNPLYKDLKINKQWLNDWQQEDPKLTNALIEGVTVENIDGTSKITSSNSDVETDGIPETLYKIADEFGFTIDYVPSNENSLFLSVLKQMTMKGYLRLTVEQLREQLADYMSCYPDQYWSHNITTSTIVNTRHGLIQGVGQEGHGRPHWGQSAPA